MGEVNFTNMKKYLLELLERFRIGDDQAREEDTIRVRNPAT